MGIEHMHSMTRGIVVLSISLLCYCTSLRAQLSVGPIGGFVNMAQSVKDRKVDDLERSLMGSIIGVEGRYAITSKARVIMDISRASRGGSLDTNVGVMGFDGPYHIETKLNYLFLNLGIDYALYQISALRVSADAWIGYGLFLDGTQLQEVYKEQGATSATHTFTKTELASGVAQIGLGASLEYAFSRNWSAHWSTRACETVTNCIGSGLHDPYTILVAIELYVGVDYHF